MITIRLPRLIIKSSQIEDITNDHKCNCKLKFINNFHHTNDISFIIGNKKSWGKGYSNEAVKLC